MRISVQGNQIMIGLMNEYDKLPKSIQYLADYDSFIFIIYYFFSLKRGDICQFHPHLDPHLDTIEKI